MYSITAIVVLSSPCAANRIVRDFEGGALDVEVDASVDVEESVAEPLQTLNSLPPGAGDAVDWHFMTDTFSWAGRGDQELYDTVQGHACQANGWYDNSYSASSLCYWHPETEHIAPQHWGLSWRGGYGPREFCGEIGIQRGVCARCNVCHDNSRDSDAAVDLGNDHHLEIIPLPECMKEVNIEMVCNQHFDGNNGQLLNEETRCREIQGRYDEAVVNFNTINDTIAGSESSITELVQNMVHGSPQGAYCSEQTIENIRQTAVRHCRRFGIRNHHNNAQLLTMRPTCLDPTTFVIMPRGNPNCEAGTEIASQAECNQASSALRIQITMRPLSRGCREVGSQSPVCKVVTATENNATHQRCERCNGHMDTLDTAVVESDRAHAELEQWQGLLEQNHQDLTNHRNVLAQSYQNFPPASQLKVAMEAQWFPQQQHCQQVYNSVVSARNSNMMTCAPTFYDQSCEKACVEVQRSGEHGCGVVEGSQYGDAFERGGVEVTCSPPAPSWIMSPSNYGGSAQPNTGEQCGRINAEQSARATTPVMKSGWLTRPSTGFWSRAARRFYVLESGNGVRSATLRSFDGALPRGTEETNDGIIMWDAEEVSAAETSGDQACFEIKHHYDGRTTRWNRRGTTTTICVTRDDSSGNMRELRDQWVSVLQELLVWRPRVA